MSREERALSALRAFTLWCIGAFIGAALTFAMIWGWTSTGENCPDAPPGWLGFCEAAV